MLIDQLAGGIPLQHACDLMDVSRSEYYDWKKPKDNQRQRDDALSVHIKEIFRNSRRVYGARRIQEALKKRGIGVGRRKISYFMNKMGLCTVDRRKFRVRTTDSRHKFPIVPNILNRDFSPQAPNRVWATDTTYIVAQEGFLYLTTVTDLFSRRIVGYAMSNTIDANLSGRVCAANGVSRPKA